MTLLYLNLCFILVMDDMVELSFACFGELVFYDDGIYLNLCFICNVKYVFYVMM